MSKDARVGLHCTPDLTRCLSWQFVIRPIGVIFRAVRIRTVGWILVYWAGNTIGLSEWVEICRDLIVIAGIPPQAKIFVKPR